jgi:hypothetical protein
MSSTAVHLVAMTKRGWQNVYKGARESFHVPGAPSECGQIHLLD